MASGVDIARVLASSAAVLFVPGLLLVLATRVDRALSIWMLPAASLAGSLALLAPALLVTLAVGAPLAWCTAWLGACLLVAAPFVVRRFRGRRERRRIGDGSGVGGVAGVGVVAVALLCGALSLHAGADLRRDQVYHTARTVKLLELDSPTFASVSRFEGSGVSAPYALPLWHGLVAISAQVGGASPTLVFWTLPALLGAVIALALAGLAAMLWRSAGAALLATCVWVATRIVDYIPDYRFLSNIQWPGHVAALVLVPLICACAAAAFDRDPRDGTTRRAVIAGATAVLLVVVLHANYVLYPALLVLGFVLWALIWAPRRDRPVLARRAAVMCTAWASTAALGLAAFLQVYRQHEQFGADAGASGTGVRALVESSRNSGYFERSGDGYVLALDPIMDQPLTIVAVALCGLLAVVAPRERATAFAVGGTLLVLALARLEPLLGPVLSLGSLGTATRLWLALVVPTVLGLTGVLLVVARRLSGLRDAGQRGRAATALLAATVGTVLLWSGVHPLAQEVVARELAVVSAVVLPVVALAACAAGATWRARRPRRWMAAMWPASHGESTDPPIWALLTGAALLALSVRRLARGATGVEAAVLPVAAAITLVMLAVAAWYVGRVLATRTWPPAAPRKRQLAGRALVGAAAIALVAVGLAAGGDQLTRRYAAAVARDPDLAQAMRVLGPQLRTMDAGNVVLADEDISYALPAAAPVYAVGDYKHWLETEAHPLPATRLKAVRRVFGHEADLAGTDAVIERYDPDVLVARATQRVALAWARDAGGCARQMHAVAGWVIFDVRGCSRDRPSAGVS